MRRFLLGGLSEEAGRGVEERLMTDEAFLEELTLAEGELIDDYVAGRLTAEERAEFDGHFLSSEARRRQLSFTRELRRYANDHAPPEMNPEEVETRRPAYDGRERVSTRTGFVERLRAFRAGLSAGGRAGLAFASVAVVAFALWLAGAFGPRAPQTFFALALAPAAGERAATTPGERPAVVTLPLNEDALRLTLALPGGAAPAASYRAELSREATSVGTFEAAARQDARAVTVDIPASSLARGRHALRLKAAGADGADAGRVGTYLFDVE